MKKINLMKIFLVIACVLVVVFSVTDLFFVGIFALIFSIVLMSTIEYALPILLLYSLLDYDIPTVYGKYPITILMIVFVIFGLLRTRQKFTIARRDQVRLVLIIVFSISTAVFTSTVMSFSFKDLLFILLIIFFCINKRVNTKEIYYNIIIIVIAAFIFLLISYLINPIDINLGRYLINDKVNINSVAFIVMQVLSMLFALVLISQKMPIRILLIAMCLFLCYLLICYSSRSSIFAGVITCFISLFVYKSNNKKASKIISIFIVIIGLFYIVNTLNWNSDTLQRLHISSIVSDNGSNRFFLWKTIIFDVIPSNMLFGVGFDPEGLRNALVLSGSSVITGYTHSFVLGCLTRCGMVTGLMFMHFFINAFSFTALKNNRLYLLCSTLYLSTIIAGVGEETCFYRSFLFSVLLLYIIKNSICDSPDNAAISMKSCIKKYGKIIW